LQKTHSELAAKLEQELRRGVLILAVLSQLKGPQYGYSLRQLLAARGMPIEEGTLYPLLRRMEEQGLLKSEWKIEDGPPRRYYARNGEGERVFRALAATWRALVGTVEGLMQESTP
jgi:PadR family transcriptional regulator, regulatory protein PadR